MIYIYIYIYISGAMVLKMIYIKQPNNAQNFAYFIMQNELSDYDSILNIVFDETLNFHCYFVGTGHMISRLY
jgi:hypothetical protein